MKKWPLKLKFGIYAASLTTLALIATAALTLPYIYFQQLAELDKTLSEDAKDLFDALERLGGDLTARQPLGRQFIPTGLKNRYLEIRGAQGEVLLRSGTLRKNEIGHLPEGMKTVRMYDNAAVNPLPPWNARIGTFRKNDITLRVGTRLGTIEGVQRDVRAAFTFAVPIMAVGVFMGGLFLARRALRPVAAMTAAAERISARQPAERLPIPESKDEIARLTVAARD